MQINVIDTSATYRMKVWYLNGERQVAWIGY